MNGNLIACVVCCSSELPAAPDEHLVRTSDGVHAVVDPVEETASLDRLRSSAAILLPRLHPLARF